MTMASNRINILIPTRNRPLELERLLKSLRAQSNPNFAVTIIDASDHKLNEVQEVVNSISGLEINYQHTSRFGSCTQRNLGLTLIKENLILFTDDDCCFDPPALEAAYQFIHAHPETTAYSLELVEQRSDFYRFSQWLKRLVGLSNRGCEYIIKKNGINVFGDKARRRNPIEWLPTGALVVVRANVPKPELLKFNEHLERFSPYASSEDAYFTYNLYLHGGRLGLAGDARVYHLPTGSARVGSQLNYMTRTYNRYTLWRDLIYPRDKRSIYPFLLANVFFLVQYFLAALAFNYHPVRGHWQALKMIFRELLKKTR